MTRHILIFITATLFLAACRTPIDPAIRAKALSKGHPLFMPVLDYQVNMHILPEDITRVRLVLPDSESPSPYIQGLSTCYPNITFVTGRKDNSPVEATLTIDGIRRTGALIGEVFASVTINGSRRTALYYLGTRYPKRGEPQRWFVVKADPWPDGAALPLKHE